MKSKSNKILVDIITIALLLAAFIFAFVMGFVNRNGATGEYYLNGPIISLIAVGGLGILYFSGSVVELVSRIKKDKMTVGFVALFSVMTVAYVAVIAVMLAMLCELMPPASFLVRFVYIAAVLIIIGGYYESVVYSAKLEAEAEEIIEIEESEEPEETAEEE